MAKAKKQEEPSLRDQLLADYDRMEKSIEEASQTELWELADWLAQYIPEAKRGRPSGNAGVGSVITLSDLAAQGHRTDDWLQRLRKVAKDTEPERLSGVTPSVYIDALRSAKGDLAKANATLKKQGNKRRDHRAGEGTKAIVKAILQKSQEDKEEVARAIYRDIGPVTIPNDEEDIDDKIDDEEERPPHSGSNDDTSRQVRPSAAYCAVPTVEEYIDSIEQGLKNLFETGLYKISKRDKKRLREIIERAFVALEG